MPRILAVDWGAKRIGLAVSDPTGLIATGLETLTVRGSSEVLARLVDLIREEGVEQVVVGLPLLMSGEAGSAARTAREFAERLRETAGVPVDTYDERLTSVMSERRLRELSGESTKPGVGRRRRPRGRGAAAAAGRVDQGAAVALLESYLQWRRARSNRRA